MSEIILRIENLRKEYSNAMPIKNINLEVERGEIISIIGPSGTGKSTFLRIINRLEEPTAGKIFFGGENILSKNCRAEIIRQKIGMIFQSFNLFAGMTVIENLIAAPVDLKILTKQAAYEKAKNFLKTVGLEEKIFNYPEQLSGGQQQRVAIIRALMMQPEILLFDEPTSALDPTMVGEVLAVIRMLAKENLTMLIVTHEMNFAREVADRILFFADGEIYEQGTPQEIFENPQREKTIAFINRQKYFNYKITDKNFDLNLMQNKILNFAEKYGYGEKYANRLQLCCEEIIFEMLENCFGAEENISLTLEIIYSEIDKNSTLNLICGGKNYNPFVGENISTTILKKISENFSHSYENNFNKIKIQLLHKNF